MTFKTVNRLFLGPNTFMGFLVWTSHNTQVLESFVEALAPPFLRKTPVSMLLAEMRRQGAKASKETVTRYMRRKVT